MTARSATPSASASTLAQRELGWDVTNWMKTHAEALGVEYLIWDGKIWSLARNAEGWRPYDGGEHA